VLCTRRNGSFWSSITYANKSTITNDNHTDSEVSETFTGQRTCLVLKQLFVYTACCVLCSYSAYNDNGKNKKTSAVKSRTPEKKDYSCFWEGFWTYTWRTQTCDVVWHYKSIDDFCQPTGTNKIHKHWQQKEVTLLHTNKTTMFLIKNYFITKWTQICVLKLGIQEVADKTLYCSICSKRK
jgi:hypothetical protein